MTAKPYQVMVVACCALATAPVAAQPGPRVELVNVASGLRADVMWASSDAFQEMSQQEREPHQPRRRCRRGGWRRSLDCQLDAARRASRKYMNIKRAVRDGYRPWGGCMQRPDGAMGYHYINLKKFYDPALAITSPDGLLYIPNENGELELKGIEHLSVIYQDGAPYMGCGANNQTCPPAAPNPAPALYRGRSFVGPMAGHMPTMPWHFDEHVWLWAPTPAGVFQPWNPGVSCEFAPLVEELPGEPIEPMDPMGHM
jgi:hypothetical protein